MKFGGRFWRVTLSLTLAGAIYSQMPIGGGTVHAACNEYSTEACGNTTTNRTLKGAGIGAGVVYAGIAAIAGMVNTTTAAGAITTAAKATGATKTAVGSVVASGTLAGFTVTGETVLDAAQSEPTLTDFAVLLKKADAEPARKDGPYTFFAPTNDALNAARAANPAAWADLEKKENRKSLKALLQNHIVRGTYTTEMLKTMDGQTLSTLSGQTLMVTVTADGIKVNGASMVENDIVSKDGNLIHPIGQVLITFAPSTP